MPSPSPLEAAAAEALPDAPPLLFDELRQRLALRGALAEADEIQRVLGWGLVDANAQLRREALQLADVLSDLDRALGERSGSLGRGGIAGGARRPRAARFGMASTAEAVDARFERGVLEAQIAFFVDRLRRSSVPVSAPLALAAASAASAAAPRPHTVAGRHQHPTLVQPRATHSPGSGGGGGGGGGDSGGGAAGGGSRAGSAAGPVPPYSRPTTGGSVASHSGSTGGGSSGSSYMSVGREALDSAGLGSIAAASAPVSAPATTTDSAAASTARRLWDEDDAQMRAAAEALRGALRDEAEALEAEVEWLRSQLQELTLALSGPEAGADSDDDRATDNVQDVDSGNGALKAAAEAGGDIDALRSLKRDLQRRWLVVEGGPGPGPVAGAGAAPATPAVAASAAPVSMDGDAGAASRLRARRGLPVRGDGGVVAESARAAPPAAAATALAALASADDDEERFFR